MRIQNIAKLPSASETNLCHPKAISKPHHLSRNCQKILGDLTNRNERATKKRAFERTVLNKIRNENKKMGLVYTNRVYKEDMVSYRCETPVLKTSNYVRKN